MLSDGFVKRGLRPALRAIQRQSGALLAQELLYQNLVQRTAAALSVRLPPLYPVRSAANWGLLYCLLRIVTETSCRRILEIGAGQSTLFLDALSDRFDLAVTTLEAKEDWAGIVQARVRSRVLFRPLAKRDVRGMTVDGFAPDVLPETFDLVLVDGPFGTRRHSRRTSLDLLERNLADEFVVVFDDAERRGEVDTIREFLRTPAARNASWNWVHGSKDQCIVFTEAFGMLAYI